MLGQQRTGFAVSLALVMLMVPVVLRSTEEMLRLVPNELREAAFALGTPQWQTVVQIVLPTAFSGIVTGVVLGLARVMGETAPLLILGPYSLINIDPFNGDMAALPTMINQDRSRLRRPSTDWGVGTDPDPARARAEPGGRVVGRFSRVRG